jgi:hypothetical protein
MKLDQKIKRKWTRKFDETGLENLTKLDQKI